MYLKLAIRNAKRSVYHYLLYMFTLTVLLTILCFANYISIVGEMEAGFQTLALPILIIIILLVLVDYIHAFMLRQRTKELACYLLLGMKKTYLSNMFLFEFILMGLLCFVISIMICLMISLLFNGYLNRFIQHTDIWEPFMRNLLPVFLYFCVIEIFSGYRVRRRLMQMEIRELIIEDKRYQIAGDAKRYHFWWKMLTVGSLISILMLCGLAFLSEAFATFITATIIIPVFISIFAFYHCLFQGTALKRQRREPNLYQPARLYLSANLTSQIKTSAIVNGVFCTCLLVSAMSFVVGIFMIRSHAVIGDEKSQKWMGFLQMNLCVIFITIYFSVLSLWQIVEIRQRVRQIKILHYLGQSKGEMKRLIKWQIVLALLLPAVMCFTVLTPSVFLIYSRIHHTFPELLISAGGFLIIFLLMFLCYSKIVYLVVRRDVYLLYAKIM